MKLPLKAKCSECGADIAPAKDAAQLRRNIALHNRAKHGYKSPKYAENKRYARTAMLKKQPGVELQNLESLPREAALAKKRAYQKRWRSRRANLLAQKQNASPAAASTDAAVPCNLSTCPNCGTRFYMVKGQ